MTRSIDVLLTPFTVYCSYTFHYHLVTILFLTCVNRCSVLCYIVYMYSTILCVLRVVFIMMLLCNQFIVCMAGVLEQVGSKLQNLGNFIRMCFAYCGKSRILVGTMGWFPVAVPVSGGHVIMMSLLYVPPECEE